MPNAENLTPWPKGKSGNPEGRPKGSKNLSTIVQEILSDEELFEKILSTTKNKPGWLDHIPNKNAANAIVTAMTVRAMSGDHRAAEWIRRTGWGEKLDLTTQGEKITTDTQAVATTLKKILEEDETDIEPKENKGD